MRVKLEEVCKRIYAGGDVPKDRFSEEKTEVYSIPIFANAEKDEGLYGYTDEAREKELSITVAARGTIGYTAIRREPFLPVVRLITVVPDLSKVSERYLFYALKNCKPQSSGTSIPQLTVPDIKKNTLNLIDIVDQESIADRLDKLNEIINLRKEEIIKLDELIKARFVEMFGGQEFERKQLIDLIQEGAGLSYGIVVPGDNVGDGIPMVRPSDFKNGRLNLDNVYRVALDIECKYKKTRLLGDEILVQVIGQPGQVMLSDERCKGMNVTRNLAVIRIDKNKADRLFISHYLTTEEAQRFMFGSTNQSTLKQLPLNKLKELPVPIVPISEQVQFADFVKQVDKSKVAVQKALDEAQLLFNSLMQEYFG